MSRRPPDRPAAARRDLPSGRPPAPAAPAKPAAVAPPKFIVFSYDSKNWYIVDREESGSTAGLKEYAVVIHECISGSVTVT
jgi:hypothetical protein